MVCVENSILSRVSSRAHLFNSCASSGDNLFTSVAINRGLEAAVKDAQRHGWTISKPLVDSIRLLLLEEASVDPAHDWCSLLPCLEALSG